ncbi:MAG: hypothetical protein OSJ65_06390 [Bacilli bacterium]|nr:hypothetical protein [Bacilli bacterium]
MRKTTTEFAGRKVYKVRFSGIYDLYEYLKSNPPVNPIFTSENQAFKGEQASLTGSKDFAGEPLDVAIEYLLRGYKKDFESFVNTNKKLTSGLRVPEIYEEKRSPYVGTPISSLVAAGVFDCRVVNEQVEEVIAKNIYYNLSYPHYTRWDQVRNRGIATLAMIQALEERDVFVNFKAFELSRCNDEIFHFSIDLKKPGEKINLQKIYFLMVAKEFLRRVLFRVLESSDVEDYEWTDGYGESFVQRECEEYFKTKKNDIVITRPQDLSITGDDIYEDTINMYEKLGLDKELNVNKLRKLGH